jgi:hypothetical protein
MVTGHCPRAFRALINETDEGSVPMTVMSRVTKVLYFRTNTYAGAIIIDMGTFKARRRRRRHRRHHQTR